jgi:hypothetical protein
MKLQTTCCFVGEVEELRRNGANIKRNSGQRKVELRV